MDAPLAVLQWDRGALEQECDRAAIVQAGVEAYLGRVAFAADGQVIVRVGLSRIQEGGVSRVVAKVKQEDASGRAWGERTVSGDGTCASLDEPLTLVVALLVDAPPEPEEATPAEPAPAPEPPPSSPSSNPPPADETGEIQTAPSLERATTQPGHAAFVGFGAVAMGALPAAAAGGGVLALVKPRGFVGFGVQAAALIPQRKALGAGSLELKWLELGASLCPLQGVDDAVWYSACATMGVARLRTRSRDLLEAKARTEWIPLPSVAARAAWRLGHGLMVGAGLEAAFPLSADRYVYREPQGDQRTAFEMSALVVTASLGLGLLVD